MTRYLSMEDVERARAQLLATRDSCPSLACPNCGRAFASFDAWFSHYVGYCTFPVDDVRPSGVSPLTQMMAKEGDDV
jgi:hypothetical protein